MAIYFFDASAIVKYFHSESGSEWTRGIVDARNSDENGREHEVLVAGISIAEVAAAFAILERNQRIGRRLQETLYDAFLDAIMSDFQIVLSDIGTFFRAAELTQKYPLKGYDAVQLAAATEARDRLLAQELELTFVAGDAQLLRAAQSEGMRVENPDFHPNL
jgi:predicted nucleic acid-binding protein